MNCRCKTKLEIYITYDIMYVEKILIKRRLTMSQVKREFNKNEDVFVVDYWGTEKGAAAFSARAHIIEVDEENRMFIGVLYGDTYQRYSFSDYGRIVFDTSIEANKAASKLPKPGDIIYQKVGNKVYKKEVHSISGGHVNGVYDLEICFKKGKNISIKEFGVTLFASLDAARSK